MEGEVQVLEAKPASEVKENAPDETERAAVIHNQEKPGEGARPG